LAFVPKNAKTFRSIAVEPNLNVILQLGVHEFLVELFHQKSVATIDDQQPNQLLAKLGSTHSSLSDTLCTLDIRNASNSVCKTLVEWLVDDPSWFALLDSLRCHNFVFDGVETSLEMFSSMGNGFTFALETLIFKALSEGARVACGGFGVTSVYGDDIITTSASALLLVETLGFCGFSLNSDKSFIHGPFRESCGTDWYDGKCTTPVYLRSEKLRYSDVCRIYNFLQTHPRSMCSFVSGFLLRSLKPFGLKFGLENEELGSCLFTSFAYALGANQLKYHSHWQTYRFRAILEKGHTRRDASDDERYWSALLSGGAGDLPIKGRTSFVSRWMTAGTDSRWWKHYR